MYDKPQNHRSTNDNRSKITPVRNQWIKNIEPTWITKKSVNEKHLEKQKLPKNYTKTSVTWLPPSLVELRKVPTKPQYPINYQEWIHIFWFQTFSKGIHNSNYTSSMRGWWYVLSPTRKETSYSNQTQDLFNILSTKLNTLLSPLL